MRFVPLNSWKIAGDFTQGSGVEGVFKRGKIALKVHQNHALLERFIARNSDGLLARTVQFHPQIAEIFQAPYISVKWGSRMRMENFIAHIETLEHLGKGFDFDPSQSIDLLPLDMIMKGLHVVIDKPGWFVREGNLVINLFMDNMRLFSLAFSLEQTDTGLGAIIGGIQGRKLPRILDLYRDMTKAADGLRPRDLLIEIFRSYARVIGVKRISAVSDGARHHRSAYFSREIFRKLPLDYDEIWSDRGGVRISSDFFDLPLSQDRRDMADIPVKKRSMYRKRYLLLDQVEGMMAARVAAIEPFLRPASE